MWPRTDPNTRERRGVRTMQRNIRLGRRARDFAPRRIGSTAPSVIGAGLLRDYRFLEGSGTTVADFSGNGGTATFAGTGGNPTWVSGGVHFAAGQWMSTGLTASQVGSVMALVKLDTTPPGFVTITGNDGADWQFWLNGNYDGNQVSATTRQRVPSVWRNGFASTSNDFMMEASAAVLSQVSNGVADTFYVNDGQAQVSNGTNTSSGRTGNLFVGGSPNYGTNTNICLKGTLARVLLYNSSTALSQAQVAANYAAMKAAAPTGFVPPQFNTSTGRILAAEGDSITAGGGAVSSPWPTNMTLSNTYDRINFGISGQTVATMNSSGFDKIKYRYAPSAVKNVLTLFAGTNDIAISGTSPAATFAILQTLAGKYTSPAWNIVVVPMISRTGNAPGGTPNDTHMATYNASIWGATWGANTKVIQANDAFMGSGASFNFFAAGSYANPTYMQGDGTHPTQVGANLIGQAVGAQINAFG